MSWDWEKLQKKYHEETDNKPKIKKKELPGWSTSFLFYGGYIIILLIIIAIIWIPVSWISYKLKYENQVKKAIIEMVKPEALKDKYRLKTSNEQPQDLKEIVEK